MTSPNRVDQRMIRYCGLFDYKTVKNTSACIVGVGAIGFQVARALASMGVQNITLWDHDKIEELNLGTQGWDEGDVGSYKVHAASDALHQINPKCETNLIKKKYDIGSEMTLLSHDVVFACVDSMKTRRQLFLDSPKVMIDSRMSAFTIHSLYVNKQDPETVKGYEGSLFDDGEAFEGPCTERSTYYTAAIAAGLSINLFAQHLRGFVPLPQHYLYLDQMVLQGASSPSSVLQSPELQQPEDSSQESPGAAVPSPRA